MPEVRLEHQPMRDWGLPVDGELDRIVVVSPHLDDAVLGTARLLSVHPGAGVVTVFAGNPDAYPEPMRKWDVQSGFQPGDDVMAPFGCKGSQEMPSHEPFGPRHQHTHGPTRFPWRRGAAPARGAPSRRRPSSG